MTASPIFSEYESHDALGLAELVRNGKTTPSDQDLGLEKNRITDLCSEGQRIFRGFGNLLSRDRNALGFEYIRRFKFIESHGPLAPRWK